MAYWAAAAAVISAYLQKRSADKARKQTASQQSIESTLAGNLKSSSPYGLDFLHGASEDLGDATTFWRGVGTGDRSRQLSILAPELLESDRASRDATSMDALLGGGFGSGGSERRLGLLDSGIARRENALLGLRTGAVGELTNLGQIKGGLGTSILGTAGGTGTSLLNSILGRQGMQFNQDRETGQALAQMLKLFMTKNNTTGTRGTSSMGGYGMDSEDNSDLYN